MTHPSVAEYRVFGWDLAEAVPARLGKGRARLGEACDLPEQIYFLLDGNEGLNLKARDGRLEAKLRVGIGPRGVEWFRRGPVLEFPVQTADLAALGLVPPPGRACWSLADLAGLARDWPGLRLARVRKLRRPFTLGPVTGELTRVEANGARLETVAVEGPDPEALAAALAGFGLAGRDNAGYLQVLKRLVGW